MKPSEFERWLFDAEQLSQEEQQALVNAMAVSPEMRELASGWRAARADLQAAPRVDPADGFSERWRQRLAVSRAVRRRRQIGLLLAGTLAGAFASLALLTARALHSPAGLAASVMRAAIGAVERIESGMRVTGALLEPAPVAAVAVLFGVTLAWLSVIWFASLYRFAFENLTNGEKK